MFVLSNLTHAQSCKTRHSLFALQLNMARVCGLNFSLFNWSYPRVSISRSSKGFVLAAFKSSSSGSDLIEQLRCVSQNEEFILNTDPTINSSLLTR